MTYEEITSQISETQIFERYYGCSITIKSKRYKNIARGGDSLTSGFTYNRDNKVVLKDFKTNEVYNAWKFVKELHNCDWSDALRIIERDFNISRNNNYSNKGYSRINLSDLNDEVVVKKPHYKVITRDYLEEDLNYWKTFGIRKYTLDKFNVKAVDSFYKFDYSYNEYVITYRHNWSKELCFVYPFTDGDDQTHVKLYRPFNANSKWQGNANINTVFGLPQLMLDDMDELEKKTICFVASGLKDLMCLSEMGFDGICGNSESSFISEELLNELKIYYSDVIILFDTDEAGITNANKFAEKYNLKYCELASIGVNQKEKDVADYCKSFGVESTKELIKLDLLINYNLEI